MENLTLPLIFIGIGGLLILVGLILLIRNLRFAARACSTVGTVVDLEESHDEGVSYSPVVTFLAHDGSEVTFTDSISTYPAMFEIGEEVKVLYLPEKHHVARVATAYRLHLLAMIFAGIGGLFVVIGMVLR